jgi:spoIIIJ-associated protein
VSDPDDAGSPDGAPSVEGTGETVGEAKWAALRELERRFPGIEKANVGFEVVSEGERGLLGVGYAPARVVAEVKGPLPPAARPPSEPAGPLAERLREVLEAICAGLSAHASVSVSETDSAVAARLSGPDVGLLIGRRGQTIDAIQYLASAILWRADEPQKEIVVDAAGYRDRRRAALERIAERAAREARATRAPVALEPMSASERKLVHLYLRERGGVTTESEGAEPDRHVVVAPAPEPSE